MSPSSTTAMGSQGEGQGDEHIRSCRVDHIINMTTIVALYNVSLLKGDIVTLNTFCRLTVYYCQSNRVDNSCICNDYCRLVCSTCTTKRAGCASPVFTLDTHSNGYNVHPPVSVVDNRSFTVVYLYFSDDVRTTIIINWINFLVAIGRDGESHNLKKIMIFFDICPIYIGNL